MHNRAKLKQPPSEAEIRKVNQKAKMYQDLIETIFARKNAGDKSKETFDLVGNLLRINPDFYTLWNFRKELLLLPSLLEPTRLTGASNDVIRDEELNLSTEGIKKNPKSCKLVLPV